MGSDLLRKEKTLPTHTFISPHIPTLCGNQAAQGCLRSRSEMLVRKALETRGAGKSPETLLRQEEAAPHRKSISAKAQNMGTSWPKAHGRAGSTPDLPPLAPLSDARAPGAWLRPRRDVGAQGDASFPLEAASGYFCLYKGLLANSSLECLSQASH